jgi:hypothetical protein
MLARLLPWSLVVGVASVAAAQLDSAARSVAVDGVVCAPGNPDYRGAVDALVIRRGELEREIAQLPLSPLARTAMRLMCVRCIDTLTVAVLCAEIGRFAPFGGEGHRGRSMTIPEQQR